MHSGNLWQSVMTSCHQYRLRASLFILVALACAIANACSIPVFRYALEHWAPDSYRITIIHDAPLSEADADLVEQLQKASLTANAVLRVVSSDGALDAETQKLLEAVGPEVRPTCVIQLPVSTTSDDFVWTGPLSEVRPERLYSSPARTEVVRALESGESAVWVFLASGDQARDDKLFALLESETARLQESLELEPIEDADLAELSGSPDELKIRFSCVRVSRSDVAEKEFVETLLSVEPDLRDLEFVNQPMVFPVFGRGRALYALVGNGIEPSLIEEGARFLIGGCQCKVKVQNPGTDLLLTAGWETYVDPGELEAPEYVSIPGGAKEQMPSVDEEADQETATRDVAKPANIVAKGSNDSSDGLPLSQLMLLAMVGGILLLVVLKTISN